jgi:hypothetical protein
MRLGGKYTFEKAAETLCAVSASHLLCIKAWRDYFSIVLPKIRNKALQRQDINTCQDVAAPEENT